MSDLLEEFRREEATHQERIVELLGDRPLQRFVVAWTTIGVEFDRPAGKAPASQARRWEWLWAAAVNHLPSVSSALDMHPALVERLFRRAVAARMIYPDGSASLVALAFIRSQVAQAVPRRR